jgi:hypothetical protein
MPWCAGIARVTLRSRRSGISTAAVRGSMAARSTRTTRSAGAPPTARSGFAALGSKVYEQALGGRWAAQNEVPASASGSTLTAVAPNSPFSAAASITTTVSTIEEMIRRILASRPRCKSSARSYRAAEGLITLRPASDEVPPHLKKTANN